jgi:hypothetical protein
MKNKRPQGKFLVTKFEFGGCLVMSLERGCHSLKFTTNLEIWFTFGVFSKPYHKLITNLEKANFDQKITQKIQSKLGSKNVLNLKWS